MERVRNILIFTVAIYILIYVTIQLFDYISIIPEYGVMKVRCYVGGQKIVDTTTLYELKGNPAEIAIRTKDTIVILYSVGGSGICVTEQQYVELSPSKSPSVPTPTPSIF